MKNMQSNGFRKGFTLIEILVVVVILGILGAIVVPQMMGRPDQARIQAAHADLKAIHNALEMYRLDNFQYPSSEQGLRALVEKPHSSPEPKNWNPDGYLPKEPIDPWKEPYVYERNGTDLTLYSLGADGEDGGDGVNADIKFADI